MELEPKKSKLYSIDRKFTLCLKGLEKKSVGVGYFISGITKTPIFVQKSENEDEVILDIDLTHELSSYDYRWIKIETFQVVYGDDGQEFANGQNYGLYYGKCTLRLKSTGETNDNGYLKFRFVCEQDDKAQDEIFFVRMDYLDIKYVYDKGRNGTQKEYKDNIGIYLNVDTQKSRDISENHLFIIGFKSKDIFNTEKILENLKF